MNTLQDTGQEPKDSATSARLTRIPSPQLTLFSEGIHANPTALVENEKARQILVSSGRKCIESSVQKGRLGLLTKMLLGPSQIWFSTERYLSWRVKVTPAKRIVYALTPREATIRGSEYFSWPTPTASCALVTARTLEHPKLMNGLVKRYFLKSSKTEGYFGTGNTHEVSLAEFSQFPLSPQLAQCLMLPPNWLQLKVSEMVSIPGLRLSSSGTLKLFTNYPKLVDGSLLEEHLKRKQWH